MGGFGTTQPDNDPFGLGMVPSTPQTFPTAGLPSYASYGSPTTAAAVPVKKKKKSTGKSGTFWAITGTGIGTALIVVFLVLGVAGRVARSMRAAGVFNTGFSGSVEWVPHTSQPGGYAVEIVKQKPGITIPGLAGNIGINGIVSTMSAAGPCTVVNAEQLPASLSDAEVALALNAWQTQVQTMITSAAGRVSRSGPCSVAGHRGHELMFEQTEKFTTTIVCFRACFLDDRAYTMAFLATKPIYQQSHADHFFNSFRLLNNAGPAPPAASVPVPTSLPPAVFNLSPPRAPSSNWNGDDIKEMETGMLFALANRARSEDRVQEAIQFQHLGVQREQGEGIYNLACLYGMTGDANGAFYWLQRAAHEEGVDSSHLARDPDFLKIRSDPRWKQVQTFVTSCNAYFRAQPIVQIEHVIPAGYQNDRPIPVVVGLHGLGDSAKNFLGRDEFYQSLANNLGVALIAVSGTQPSGPRSFTWSENLERDRQHIEDALAKLSDRLTFRRDAVVLYGFSQGAAVSASLAANYPEQYAGAIALSPGSITDIQPPGTASPLLGQRKFVAVCGDGEHPSTLAAAKLWANWYSQHGARVVNRVTPSHDSHSFPPDFEEVFPQWISLILNK